MEREVQVGQLIAGKYRVQQLLGRGGMGVVMAALHEHLNQRVALKFLTDDAYQQPEAVARFLREARSAVQIQSEHVARVMDVGTLDSGAPYMVMEYLRGLDLKEVSTRRGPLPITEAVDFVLQACDAVAEAHSLGIIHRDLKPSNLFLTERPDGSPLVKVLDFGISKALHGGGPGGQTSKQQMTASAAIMGSPQYMSPEQIRSSKNVDARADVWALGTILHELLAGSPAYVADTVPGLLAMIVADAPPPISQSRPDIPEDLEACILRCLEKDRERRFVNVAEFARSIERYASPEVRPIVRRIARVLGDAGGVSALNLNTMGTGRGLSSREQAVQTHNTWARTGRVSEAAPTPFYSRPAVQLGGGMGIVGVALLGWFLFVRSSDPGTSPVPTATTGQTTTQSTTGGTKGPTVTKNGAPPIDTHPQSTGIRPVIESQPAPPVNPPPKPITTLPDPVVQPQLPRRPMDNTGSGVDDDPRAPRSIQDDPSLYPSTNTKKHDIAVAAARVNKKRQHRAPPPVQQKDPVEDEQDPVSPPPQQQKKTNTLDDLFNDTR
jgi:serine/threonine-protein kinase